MCRVDNINSAVTGNLVVHTYVPDEAVVQAIEGDRLPTK